MTREAVELELKKIRELSSDPEAATGVELALHRAVMDMVKHASTKSAHLLAQELVTLALSSTDIPFARQFST